jgi:hypothetical protein
VPGRAIERPVTGDDARLELIVQNEYCRTTGWRATAAAASLLCAAVLGAISLQTPAVAAPSVFQQAVNFVFTGKLDPKNGPEIVDAKNCVVVMRDPKFNRYIRYHMSRFKMDEALYTKKYSGRNAYYELSVKGDDVVVEYLSPDKKNIIQGYRTANIRLPGNIDQTRRALAVIYKDRCKAEQPKTPF